MQHLGEVGRLELGERRQEAHGPLRAAVCRQGADLVQLHEQRLAASAQPRRLPGDDPADEQPRHHPVLAGREVQADVLHDHVAAAVGHRQPTVEQVLDHEGLAGPLLEAAHVDQTGADDLARLHGRDPGHRQEHPSAAGHLDEEPDRAGPGGAEDDHDVPDPAHLVAHRVEDSEPDEAGGEDASGVVGHDL